MSIKVYYASIEALKNQTLFERIFDKLPKQRRDTIQSRKHDSGRRQALGAGALMLYGLAQLGICAGKVEIACTKTGKPYLTGDRGVSFNLSHSGDYAMAIVSDDGIAVGCDIERSEKKARDIAKRFFTEEEQQAIAEGIDFFRIWTLKESFIKTTAEGLGRDLCSFSIVPQEMGFRFFAEHAGDDYCFAENTVADYRMAICYNSREVLPVTWECMDLCEVNWDEL
ncbi:MAG: 4'-phosphopantetheinyl transferase superfamily protein [bacterium]|nr:4'-phosphopantetheinyl transferase superfamily protein [bacterium]